MSLAQKYRVQFGTARGDRLLLYLTMALAVHAGAATAAWIHWPTEQTTTPEAPLPPTPIEFVYVNSDDSSPVASDRRSQSNAAAAGTPLTHLPINAGKEIAAQKEAAPSPPKPVEIATLGVIGEIVPTQGTPSPIPSSLPEEAKAVTPAPPSLTAPALAESIPTLPSEITLPPARIDSPPLPSEPEFSTGRILPPPAMDRSAPEAATQPEPEAVEGELRAIAPAPSNAEPGPEPQPIAASGLAGVPNPDQSGPDGPVQVAARQDQLWGDYIAHINTQIEAAWARIEVEATYHPCVRFEIDRQGALVTVQLIQPSGSADADQAALEAVQTAAPFSPFPANAEDESVVINLTFNYTVTSPISIPITAPVVTNPASNQPLNP